VIISRSVQDVQAVGGRGDFPSQHSKKASAGANPRKFFSVFAIFPLTIFDL
jgi:hypothetical protein